MKKELNFVQLWAEEFKRNKQKSKCLLDKFLDSQIQQAQLQLKKIGIDKLIKIFNIRNKRLIEKLSVSDLK
ncbi:MAG: hypothetical protein ACTSX4_01160 [Candidatus Helarchaeota archaeon]